MTLPQQGLDLLQTAADAREKVAASKQQNDQDNEAVLAAQHTAAESRDQLAGVQADAETKTQAALDYWRRFLSGEVTSAKPQTRPAVPARR